MECSLSMTQREMIGFDCDERVKCNSGSFYVELTQVNPNLTVGLLLFGCCWISHNAVGTSPLPLSFSMSMCH